MGITDIKNSSDHGGSLIYMSNTYGYGSGNGHLICQDRGCQYFDRYGETFGLNDIVKCEVNFNNKTIEYYKNGKSQGIAFKNIGMNCKYKFVIAMSRPGIVKIVDSSGSLTNAI